MRIDYNDDRAERAAEDGKVDENYDDDDDADDDDGGKI